MTSASNGPGGEEDIHVLVVKFLGWFAHLQHWMDNVIAWRFFQDRMPNAANLVWERAVSRINDKERIKLFLAIAKDIGTDAELDSVATVYAGLKELRDKVAHSAKFIDYGDGRLTISKSIITSFRDDDPDRTKIDRHQLSKAIRSCNWIEAQMIYVIFQHEPIADSLSSHKIPKPARTPDQWDWDGDCDIVL